MMLNPQGKSKSGIPPFRSILIQYLGLSLCSEVSWVASEPSSLKCLKIASC